MKLALIGGGNIGKFLLQSVNIEGFLPDSKIVGIFTRNQQSAAQLAADFDTERFSSIQSLIQSDADLVIEAATVQVVRDHAAEILESGKDLVLSSVGALADRPFYHKIEGVCLKNGTRVHLPSGAIGGLDVLKAAQSIGELYSVSIITRKPPEALPGAPLEKEYVLF